jgi:hypothetical protein
LFLFALLLVTLLVGFDFWRPFSLLRLVLGWRIGPGVHILDDVLWDTVCWKVWTIAACFLLFLLSLFLYSISPFFFLTSGLRLVSTELCLVERWRLR